jgi:hypothetical protein
MPDNCEPTSTNGGRYLPRHAPAPYYVSEQQRCKNWQVPLGTAAAGAFHDDVVRGHLPAFSLVTPDACDDMHGAPSCKQNLVASGDTWLRLWMSQILTGPDYTGGKLVVIITWDEGSKTDNHIATFVVSPSTRSISGTRLYTHCSTLHTVEDLLGLSPLGCAASAPSMRTEFKL